MAARSSSKKISRLGGFVDGLAKLHGQPVLLPVRDPIGLLLWEQVGYLADDDNRLAAFQLLHERVGISAEKILSASPATLRAITRRGGAIAVNERADRIHEIADRVATKWNGNLDAVLDLPFDEARRELTKYPSIAEAGAERILLLCGANPVLGLDSNALRVLLRLGYGTESTQWAKSYRSAQAAAERELAPTVAVRRRAFLLLRLHGQTVCRRSTPQCLECPLRSDCPSARA